jgi:hypothetical protein
MAMVRRGRFMVEILRNVATEAQAARRSQPRMVQFISLTGK